MSRQKMKKEEINGIQGSDELIRDVYQRKYIRGGAPTFKKKKKKKKKKTRLQ